MKIEYDINLTALGELMLIAATNNGVCYLNFTKFHLSKAFVNLNNTLCSVDFDINKEVLRNELFKSFEIWCLSKDPNVEINVNKGNTLIVECFNEVNRYFKLKPEEKISFKFAVQLDLLGSKFHVLVWEEMLRTLHFGNICSYAGLAKQIGNEKAYRAVATANASNPIPLIVPCHRVIGKDRKLKGYGCGGIYVKEFLLTHENQEWRN
ncbi:hypothetical protein HK099_008360, partial [Clydaea vesicula]